MKWTTRDREIDVVDMETTHLINTLQLLAGDQLRARHGFARVCGHVTPEQAELLFRAMHAELERRYKRKGKPKGEPTPLPARTPRRPSWERSACCDDDIPFG
jgi:hypothetical protein